MTNTHHVDNWTYLLGAFGTVMLANAGWMLVGPHHWYLNLPAGVPDFGAFNPHFIRDVGATFFALGCMLLWGAVRPAVRVPALVAVTLFNGAHAAVHVFDTATGSVEAQHWLIDLPGVYAPALILGVMTVLAARGGRATT